MKPNFKQMSDDELRDYVKQHRTDDEAIAELFVHRRSDDAQATWYSIAGIPEAIEVIQQRVARGKSQRDTPHAS